MNTTTQKNSLQKQMSHSSGKNAYLLGTDSEGIRYWLDSPKWDCGWYWGFGYVETYTGNLLPERAKDINSHQHIESSFIGKMANGEYIHNIYDCPTLAHTTFNEKNGWVLSELFQEFYTLKKTAELFHTGGAHITTSPLKDLLTKPDYCKHINEILIPAITSKIIELLTPDK